LITTVRAAGAAFTADPVRDYLARIGRTPLLTARQEVELGERIEAGTLAQKGIEHWADPQLTRPGETNTEHGGRGVYFKDPAGHAIEMITRPYL